MRMDGRGVEATPAAGKLDVAFAAALTSPTSSNDPRGARPARAGSGNITSTDPAGRSDPALIAALRMTAQPSTRDSEDLPTTEGTSDASQALRAERPGSGIGSSTALDSAEAATPPQPLWFSDVRDSSGWAGAIVYGSRHVPIRTISAVWTVPSAAVPFDGSGVGGFWRSSQWVGIDGYGESDLIQTGTTVTVKSDGTMDTPYA
ncbi:MAG: G1 family glutamic endopeptidase, partial [Polyangiales bacterium]